MKQITDTMNLPCLYLSASVVHFGLVCPRWSVLSSKDLCGCAVGPQDQKKERKQLLHVGIPTFHSRKNITPRVHTHPFLSDAACFQHTRRANSPTLNRHIIMRSLFLVRAKSNLSRHACMSISRAYLWFPSLALALGQADDTTPLCHSQQIQLATTHRA